MVNLYEVFNKKVEFMFSISPYTKDIINEGFPLVLYCQTGNCLWLGLDVKAV